MIYYHEPFPGQITIVDRSPPWNTREYLSFLGTTIAVAQVPLLKYLEEKNQKTVDALGAFAFRIDSHSGTVIFFKGNQQSPHWVEYRISSEGIRAMFDLYSPDSKSFELKGLLVKGHV